MSSQAVRKHVMLQMRLVLPSVPVETLQTLAGRLERLGLTPTTLAQEMSRDGESAVLRAYVCHNECRKRQPPVELRQQPIPWEAWRESICMGAEALPDAYFIAKHDEEYVAVSMLGRIAGKPSVLESGFTGTLPQWSRRGVAKALKAAGLLWALEHDYRQIESSNLQINRAIVAINVSLGFRVIGRHLHAYPIPPGR